jgi:hypothetical protein
MAARSGLHGRKPERRESVRRPDASRAARRRRPLAYRMLSSATESIDQIKVLRRHGSPECNVVVTVRGRQMVLKCRHFKQAAKWAGIEAKPYKIPNEFSVEWAAPNNFDAASDGVEKAKN